MEHALKNVRKVRWVLVALALGILTLTTARFSAGEEQVLQLREAESERYIPETATYFPYEVAGIVTADSDVIIRAQTAGTIGSVYVREGDVVVLGEALLTTEVPLASARVALQDAENEYARLSHEGSLITATSGAEKAEVHFQSVNALARITATSTKDDGENTAKLLTTQLYGSILALTTALDFTDEHRAYFPSESMREYRETLGTLYGKTPSYLIGGVRYAIDSNEDILGILERAREDGALERGTLLELSKIIDGEIATVNSIFTDAEHDFLDEQTVDPESALYSAYLDTRGALVSAMGDLETAIALLSQVESGTALTTEERETAVALGGIDRTSARAGAENARALGEQNVRVGEAGLGVLASEIALGRPTAPFAGTIVEVFVEEGEYVTPGTPLFRLSGAGARELRVTVPATLLSNLRVGQEFTVGGAVFGSVSRFAPVARAGSIAVFIDLTGGEHLVGSTLVGDVVLDAPESGLLRIHRPYLRFGSDGAYVETEDGEEVLVTIVYDAGEVLYVVSDRTLDRALTPSTGLRF